MNVYGYPRDFCLLHGDEWCPRCDPDTWLEDLEARDWIVEKGGRDFRRDRVETLERLIPMARAAYGVEFFDDTTDEGWL